jgi:hypothetical protein
MTTKFFLPILVSLLTSSAFAAPESVTSVYDCTSAKTGETIKAIPDFGEITVTNKEGFEVASIDGLGVRTLPIFTHPVTTLTFFTDEEGNTILALTEMGEEITAVYENDSSLTCKVSLQ